MGAVFTLLFLLLPLLKAETLIGSITSTYTLVSAVTYTLNLTFPSKNIPANSYAFISLSNNFNLNTSSLTNTMFATTLSSSYSPTPYSLESNTTNNLITFANIYPVALNAETLLSLKLQMPNPWGAGLEQIALTIFDSLGNNLTLRQTYGPTYWPSPLDNCQWISSSPVNGAISTRTISFISSVLLTNSYLQVTIPLWLTAKSNVVASTLTCSNVSNLDLTPSCTYMTVGSNEVYNISNLFSSNKSVSTTVSLNMSNLYNPWSLNMFFPINYTLYSTQNGVSKMTQNCTGLSQTNTEMNKFNSFSVTATLTTINGIGNGRFVRFNNTNPIPVSGGQLRLSWSSGVTITYTVQSGVTVVSQNTSQITISNFASTTMQANTNTFLQGWNFTNPPSSRPFTLTLTSLYSINGSVYGIDSSTNSYNCTPGTISNYSLISTSYAINAVATYTMVFNIIYPLASGSFIAIIFPAYITASGTCSSTNPSLACTLSNNSYANISVSATIAAGTSLNVKFNTVTNPTQAFTTASFNIFTYYDKGLDSLVDRLTSGMTFKSVANVIPQVNVFVVPSSFFTYASCNYIFSVQMVDKILAGGYISIDFPPTITLTSVSLLTASFSTATCVLNPSGNTLSITGCFSSTYNTLSISFTLSGINNPPSLQPTDSFAIKTFGPLGMINQITSGLPITMTDASTSPSFTLIPQALTVRTFALYILSVSFFTPHNSSDYMLLSIPSSMQFSASPGCPANSGIAVVTCSVLNATTLKMILSATPSASLSFNISTIRNYDISATPISLQAYVYSSTGYLMEITPTYSSTYSPAAIISYSVSSNNQIVLNSASNITLTLSPPFSIDSSFNSALTSLIITLPVELTMLGNSSCSSAVGSACNNLNSTSFQVVAAGISIVNASIQLVNIKLPFIVGNSSSFAIQYLYNGKQVALANAGVVVVPYCTSPCQQCSTPTLCLSCLPSPNNFTLYYASNNSCLDSCPSGYFPNITQCSSCVLPCVTCTSATLCLSCSNTTIFYALNNTCLGACPNGYYNDTTSGNCTLCVAPCSTCTSSTSCLSCLTNYLSNNSCVNASNCPAGTYANISTHSCDSCQSPCVTCYATPTNCTSCNGSYALYNGSCLSSCPATMYANSSLCVACHLPCGNCSSPSFCLSCIATYLFNGTCYNSSACPSGTFANLTAFTCDVCAINCSTCAISLSNCTSCNPPYFYYNGSCINSCPSGLFQNGTLCSSCVAPCNACTNVTVCLSCIGSYLTNFTCVNASLCPAGTYANTTNLSCEPCTSNCTTCSNSPFNCTSCTAPNAYFNNTCANMCPSGLFINGTLCSQCVSPCTTCTSSSICQSCNGTFYTNSTCVNASLCPSGTYANTANFSCNLCSSNCTTCQGIASNCTSCTYPNAYFNSTCTNACPSGLFQNGTICSNCIPPCLTCTNVTICLSCTTSFFYFNYTCLNASACPIGTYANSFNKSCDSCSINCSACSLSPSNCTSCASPYFNYNGSCVNSCPPGLFQNSSVCSACVSPCLTCSNVTICLSCSSNFYYNFTCVNASQCPAGTFPNLTANNCDPCSSNCSTCSLVASNCTSCLNPLAIYNSSCVNNCPSGLFKNSTVCSFCVGPCLTCSTAINCTSCNATYLTNFTCVNDTQCPSGTFANLTAFTCDVCAINCSTCAISLSNCTSCNPPYFYYNGSCINSCPSGLFQNGTLCSSCVAPCNACTNVTVCLSCIGSYLTNFTCVNASLCPAGTYANTTNLSCEPCTSNCTTCSNSPFNCTSCTAPNAYFNNTCANMCPSGLFINGTLCSQCVSPCTTCTSSSICQSCNGTFYTNSTCVNASLCPSGTYANTANFSCNLCSSNCTTCSNTPINCTSCTSPNAYFNNTCTNTCPTGLFINGTLCSSCIPPCLTCTNVTVCLSCSFNYLTNFSCLNASQCPVGTYANSGNKSCDSCSSNCSTCSFSASNCTTCTSPLAYYGNQCVSLCPNGTFQNSTICDSCVSPCGYCSSPTICLTCANNYFFYNQTCLNSSLCPNGTYANSSTFNCSPCVSPCLTCSTSQSTCTSCMPPWVYTGGQCLGSCPALTYNSSSVCLSCPLPCANCTSNISCLSCGSGFLTNNSCVNSSGCPNGTYAESANKTCSSCIPPCTSCSTVSNCFTCSSPYLFFNFTCTSNCPNGTFLNGSACSTCDSSCQTCITFSKCSSCSSTLNLYNNTCISGCPPGTFNSSNACTNCSLTCFTCSNSSSCTGCSGSLFLNNGQCQSVCPSGTFADSSSNTCSNCSSSCATCSSSSSNCSTCPSSLLFYSFACSPNCPTNYFNLSGICTTCPNCITCTNLTTCFICATGYYLYAGVCYASCPPVAPKADSVTFTCSLCGASCSSCSTDGAYCFSCTPGYLMLTGQCYITCPSGYTADSSATKCTAIKPVSLVYFPFSISLACLSLIFLYSKVKYAHSDLIGNITAFLGLGFLFSVAVLAFPTYVSSRSASRLLQTVSSSAQTFLLGAGICILSVLFLTGAGFVAFIHKKFEKDAGFLLWKKNNKMNRFMLGLVSVLSCFHFAIFRLIYSKLFLRECFSCYFKGHKRLLFATNVLTFITILLTNVPSIALSTYLIMKQEGNSQTQIFAIDNLIISAVLGVFLLLDMGNRTGQDFQMMLQDFPYLKKTKKYQDLDSSSGSLISIHYSQEEPHYKTQADEQTKGKLGQVKIKGLGNFGAIEQLDQMEDGHSITKTMPEYNNLRGEIDFNPFELKRVNDDLFFQEKQYTKKFNEIKEEYTKGLEEEIDDDGATHNNEDLFRQSINVQEIINQRKKEVDPQEYLNRFRSEDYDDLNEEEMALLMEMAEQKGLDPTFIKETFGKNKYFNSKILEDLIGDHEQVSKQSVQQLLGEKNSQSKLREVFGKKSTISTDKLIDLLNDQHFRPIIEAMFNKDRSFLSTEAIKELLADNGKYSSEFIIKLLNDRNIDRQKLKLLLESNKEGQLETLKTVKELGGDQLQKEERLSNMLGRESPLNPTLIPKIRKEMSQTSISNVFDKRTPANNIIIKRVINNKRVNLAQLNPISEMPQIIQELAQLMTCGNEDMEENLIQLLENNNVDGEKLKELIANSGNSQQEMAKLLHYIKENKENGIMNEREETPVQKWEEEQEQEHEHDGEQSSLPSLNFSINEGEQKMDNKKIIQVAEVSSFDEDSLFQPRSRKQRTRFRKKQTAPVHLPSQEIYLQRIQAPHQVERNKKFRKGKKKTTKVVNKFMDEDNEVYDLDF